MPSFASSGAMLRVFDLQTLALARTYDRGGELALAPDGCTAAVGTEDGSVTFLDLETGEMEPGTALHEAAVTGMRYTANGGTLVTTGDDRYVLVWDVSTKSVRETLQGHSGSIRGPALSADGRTAFTSCLDGKVIVWDIAGDRRLGRPFTWFDPERSPEDDRPTGPTALAPDGRTVAVTRRRLLDGPRLLDGLDSIG